MLDIKRLRKVWALTQSPVIGERDCAITRAIAMLDGAGMTLADLPALLKDASADSGSQSRRDDSAFSYEDDAPYDHAEMAEIERRRAKLRKAMLAKYGSLEAAKAPSKRERAIDAACAGLVQKGTYSKVDRKFEPDRIDGWHRYSDYPLSERVVEIVRLASPFPTTIAQAKAEYDEWIERNQELQIAYDVDFSNIHPSLPCQIRQLLVIDALEDGIIARTLAELTIRQTLLIDSALPAEVIVPAVLRDLERLACCKETVGPEPAVHNGQYSTATERHAAVVHLLSTLDRGGLSDREIARRAGVSPQTVGNIRRKMTVRAQEAA